MIFGIGVSQGHTPKRVLIQPHVTSFGGIDRA